MARRRRRFVWRPEYLAKHATAARLSKAAGQRCDIHFEPNGMVYGDPKSRGHVFHALVDFGAYELDLYGRITPGLNMIAVDDRRGPVRELLASELRRAAKFYERLACRIEGERKR